jgi:hypothetical protein
MRCSARLNKHGLGSWAKVFEPDRDPDFLAPSKCTIIVLPRPPTDARFLVNTWRCMYLTVKTFAQFWIPWISTYWRVNPSFKIPKKWELNTVLLKIRQCNLSKIVAVVGNISNNLRWFPTNCIVLREPSKFLIRKLVLFYYKTFKLFLNILLSQILW